jgi:hypothetical protein
MMTFKVGWYCLLKGRLWSAGEAWCSDACLRLLLIKVAGPGMSCNRAQGCAVLVDMVVCVCGALLRRLERACAEVAHGGHQHWLLWQW